MLRIVLLESALHWPLRHTVRCAGGGEVAQEALDLVGGDAGERHIRAQVGLELSERVGIISHGVRAEVLGLLFQQESFDRLGECELLHPCCLRSGKCRSDNVSSQC